MRVDPQASTLRSSTKFVRASLSVDMTWTSGGDLTMIGGHGVDGAWTGTSTPRARPCAGVVSFALLADDVHAEVRDDLGMEADRDGRLAERLDGLVERDASPLDLQPLRDQEVDDVLGGDRAEELPLLGRLAMLLIRQGFDATAGRVGITLDTIGLRLLLLFDVVEVLEVAGGGAERELLRNEKVARIAVRYVAHLAPAADLRDIVEQDDLHRVPSPSPRTATAPPSASASPRG